MIRNPSSQRVVRILLIEDEALVRLTLEEMLTELGHEVL